MFEDVVSSEVHHDQLYQLYIDSDVFGDSGGNTSNDTQDINETWIRKGIDDANQVNNAKDMGDMNGMRYTKWAATLKAMALWEQHGQ